MSDLRFDQDNARKHPDRNLKMLEAALRDVGAARSIVINERNRILAGEGVVKAATGAGIKKLRIIDAAGDELIAVRRRGLSKAAQRRLAIYDNRAGELSEWNTDQLRAASLEGFDLTPFFTNEELAHLLGLPAAPGGKTDPDFVPEPRKTSIKLGQMFELGAHRLLCGDATNAESVARLLRDERIDLVVTSPPYNVNIKYRSHKDHADRDTYLAFIAGTARAFVPRMAPGRFVAWNIGVSPKTFPHRQVVALEDQGLEFYRQIVWKKSGVAYPIFPSSMKAKRARHYKPNYTHEVIQVFEAIGDAPLDQEVACSLCDGTGKMTLLDLNVSEGHDTLQLLTNASAPELGGERLPDRRYQNDVWEISQSQSTVGLRTIGTKSTTLKHGGKAAHTLKEHPAPFPVEVPRAVMVFLTVADEVVFDPFGGSGSTIIACEQMRRAARLTELDPMYCQIVIDRWEAFTGLKAVKVSA